MATSLARQAASYPLAAYNFRVTVAGASLRFARVSGLQREHQTLTYRDGLSFLDGERIVKYYVDRYVPVTLEQGTVGADHALHDWLETRDPVAMDVQLCDASGTPVMAWRIQRALPVKLSVSTLDAESNGLVIDTLEIRAAGVSIVDLREGA